MGGVVNVEAYRKQWRGQDYIFATICNSVFFWSIVPSVPGMFSIASSQK